MVRQYGTEWHGQPALALETDQLRVITVPGMGAKIVSLVNKAVDHEWLLGPADRPFQPVPYGASFVAQDMSGWDEMYPTIVAGTYPDDAPEPGTPHAGNALPDHGEVWALPWDVVVANDAAITLAVTGRALPYRLARTMSLPETGTLRLAYAVENRGDAPFVAFWAAHPQFAVTPATVMRLPESITTVRAVQPVAEWAPTGTDLTWPVAHAPDGEPLHLDRVESAAANRSRKVYTLPDDRPGWALLAQTDAGHWLRLSWDADQVPYLGIWCDEGEYNPELTIALEPASGFYDSLSRAWHNRRVPILNPGERMAWTLDVAVGGD